MDNADLSRKRQKHSNSANRRSPDDIPEALRDATPSNSGTPSNRASSGKPIYLIGGLLAVGAIAVGAGLWYFTSIPSQNITQPIPTVSPSPTVSSPATPQTPVADNPSPANSDNLLGHLPYQEAPESELAPILPGSSMRLRQAAAQEFQAMVQAARASGVNLVPISGFRSTKDQQHIYFDIQAERGQSVTKRAEVSAPPGYSEHHTGYAVDIGDGNTPATNLNTNFEKTKAFKWLEANAARFHFEMSFPKNNSQGVNYEPWHWRFVGDRDSLETFYKAKNLSRKTP
ncbi:M15 family metallopeptidase [Scytonema millei]|uniref:D-alanyl-D-alanine carboxypeptidase family protein n=1 Tax=Scytonema millei VB511283 TaxID=1245923 RepID=A0A9X5I3Y1_9CYAN|nr:M15 family metallopeptidase [Scytonema millei]NHC34034.1 D-alanyl-D-alanine carboxypeptidase family protein [Scytonema millei VB511283]